MSAASDPDTILSTLLFFLNPNTLNFEVRFRVLVQKRERAL